jgi:hypothetical protein
VLRIEEIVGNVDDDFRDVLLEMDDERLQALLADRRALSDMRPVGISHRDAQAIIHAILDFRAQPPSPPEPRSPPDIIIPAEIVVPPHPITPPPKKRAPRKRRVAAAEAPVAVPPPPQPDETAVAPVGHEWQPASHKRSHAMPMKIILLAAAAVLLLLLTR